MFWLGMAIIIIGVLLLVVSNMYLLDIVRSDCAKEYIEEIRKLNDRIMELEYKNEVLRLNQED